MNEKSDKNRVQTDTFDHMKLKSRINTENVYNKDGEILRNIYNEMEDWNEILRMVGLTNDELEKLSKNKMFSKVIEALELLNRLLIDKNLQVTLLTVENENLNTRNCVFVDENMLLQKRLVLLEKEAKEIKSSNRLHQPEIKKDDSMVYLLIEIDKQHVIYRYEQPRPY